MRFEECVWQFLPTSDEMYFDEVPLYLHLGVQLGLQAEQSNLLESSSVGELASQLQGPYVDQTPANPAAARKHSSL